MVKMNIVDLDFSLKMHTLNFSNSRDVVKKLFIGILAKENSRQIIGFRNKVRNKTIRAQYYKRQIIYIYIYKTVTNSSLERETGINNFHCLSLLYITYLKSLI